MVQTEAQKVQAYLDQFSWFNDGHGLIVPPSVAEVLRSLGIEGPYVVSRSVPSGGAADEIERLRAFVTHLLDHADWYDTAIYPTGMNGEDLEKWAQELVGRAAAGGASDEPS